MATRENRALRRTAGVHNATIADAPRLPDQIAGSPLQKEDDRRRPLAAVEGMPAAPVHACLGARGRQRRAGIRADRRYSRSRWHPLRSLRTGRQGN
jgi:hypothetical protein